MNKVLKCILIVASSPSSACVIKIQPICIYKLSVIFYFPVKNRQTVKIKRQLLTVMLHQRHIRCLWSSDLIKASSVPPTHITTLLLINVAQTGNILCWRVPIAVGIAFIICKQNILWKRFYVSSFFQVKQVKRIINSHIVRSLLSSGCFLQGPTNK